MKPLLCIVVFSLTLGSLSWADDINIGSTAIATTSVSVRASPPARQLFGVSPPGEQLFTLNEGTSVNVLNRITVTTFSGNTVWIQISVINPQNNQLQQGWCFLSDGRTTQFKSR